MRLGAAVGVSEEIGGLPVCAGPGHRRATWTATRRTGKRRAEGRSWPRAADPRARPADEGGRASTTSAPDNVFVGLLHRAAPGRLPRAGPRPGRPLRARVELRQIGPRDEARVQGGIGPCGRDLCCATFLKDFEPVTVRMAKDQDLPVNPLRISGACGRLMCCLKYEHPLYQEFRKDAPPVGTASPRRPGTGHGGRAQRPLRHRGGQAGRRRQGRRLPQGQRLRVRQAYESMHGKAARRRVRPGRRRWLAAAAILLAGCSSSSSVPNGLPSTLPAYYAQHLAWQPCDNGFQCARLLVPSTAAGVATAAVITRAG